MNMDRNTDEVVNTLTGGNSEDFAADGVLQRIDLNPQGEGKWYWWIIPFVNFIVVDTDYDNYAILYGCNDWGLFHTRQAWYYSRTPTTGGGLLELAKQALNHKMPEQDKIYDFDAQWVKIGRAHV